MPNPLALLPNAVSQPRVQIIAGKVSPNMPAPATFNDPLYVVRPNWRPDYYWAVADWPACHGNTLPAQGTDCLLALDEQGGLWVLHWKGTHS